MTNRRPISDQVWMAMLCSPLTWLAMLMLLGLASQLGQCIGEFFRNLLDAS